MIKKTIFKFQRLNKLLQKYVLYAFNLLTNRAVTDIKSVIARFIYLSIQIF